MTAEAAKTVEDLKTRVQMLILHFQQEKENNATLSQALAQVQASLQDCQAQCSQWESNYNNLKMAKMLEISDTDLNDAKSRISHLVREIEKCIAAVKNFSPEVVQP